MWKAFDPCLKVGDEYEVAEPVKTELEETDEEAEVDIGFVKEEANEDMEVDFDWDMEDFFLKKCNLYGEGFTSSRERDSYFVGALAPVDTITIKLGGADKMATPTNATLDILGTDKLIFGSTVNWNKTTGFLVLTVGSGQSLAANTNIQMEIWHAMYGTVL